MAVVGWQVARARAQKASAAQGTHRGERRASSRIVRRASYGAPAPTGEADGEEFGDADGEEHRRRREGVLS